MLTPKQVEEIRKSRASLAKLAAEYACSKSTIANIRAGRTYKNPTICHACGQPINGV